MERENRRDREKKTEIDNIEDLASLLLPNTDRHTHSHHKYVQTALRHNTVLPRIRYKARGAKAPEQGVRQQPKTDPEKVHVRTPAQKQRSTLSVYEEFKWRGRRMSSL